MYTTNAFFLARALSQVPLPTVAGFLFCVIAYFASGMTTEDDGIRFARYFGMYVLVLQLGSAILEFFSAVGRDAEIANVLGTVSLVVMILFSGFLLVERTIPRPWIFVYYVSCSPCCR